MNTGSVESYLAEGCGRCVQYQTPTCKVHRWQDALVELRAVVLETGLDEQLKWGCPCYSLAGAGNVAMVVAFKEYACLSFFKGSLLADPTDQLRTPGPNSQAARLLTFTSAEEVRARRPHTLGLLRQAIELERAGAKVQFSRTPEPVPDELRELLEADPALGAAFDALTPGRQRSHILHVSGAKTVAARTSRAARCAEKIRAGKGFLDR